MQTKIKSWNRYFIVAGVLGVCINLIYLAVPVYMMVVYDRVMFSFSKPTLYALTVGVLISLLIMGVLDYLRRRVIIQAGIHLARKWSPFVLKQMIDGAGGIKQSGYQRGIEDLESIKDAVCRGHVFHILDLPWVLIYLFLLYLIHPLMGATALAGAALITLFHVLLRRLEKKRYIVSDLSFRTNADFFRACKDHAAVTTGMGMLTALVKQYTDGYHKSLAEKADADRLHAGTGALLRVIHGVTLTFVFGSGVYVFFSDQITAGAIFGGVIMVTRLFYPLEAGFSQMAMSIDAMAAYARLKSFVDTRRQKETLSLPPPEGAFSAEAVSLVVEAKPLLHNISFSLDPGESMGILGPSTSGKTVLARVLLGVWPASAGKIRLDGAEIAQWSSDELGPFIGYMPQEPELFPGSVAWNIARLGEVDAEKVVAAAQKAGAHEMILKLPKGYDTLIEAGNLSAGQRQFISLARALYGDPKLVILDEPHTHLDDLGQKALATTLKGLKQDQVTTLLITDRSSLLPTMDKIMVLKDGQAAMYGPAREVIQQLMNRQQPQQAAGV